MSDHPEIPGQAPIPADAFSQPFAPQSVTDFPQPPPGFGPGGFPQHNPHLQPGFGPLYPPPQKQSNGLAIAGAVLSVFFWPLGLVFSIIGLVKSKALGGAGRTAAIIGLVISTIFAVSTIAGVVVLVNGVKNATALDPGCRYTEPAIAAFLPGLSTDQTDIDNDVASSDQAGLQTDSTKAIGDLQSLQSGFNQALAVGTHESVKAAVGVATNDVTALTTDLDSLELDSPDSVSPLQVDTDFGTLLSAIESVNSLCGSL
jgi:hypothetical protein